MSEVFNGTSEFPTPSLPPVPCQFCDKRAAYSPLPELELYGMRVFFCHPCQAEYVYRENLWSSSIYADVNGKKYRWTNFGDRYTLYHILNPGIPGVRLNRGIDHVASFKKEDAVGITPSNLVAKIKTWLPFL